MAELQDAALEPPPTRRDRSVEARKATRLKKGVRDGRIVDILNRGVSMPELATREGVTTLRRMQILVRNILAKRTPQPPTEYLALQVNRLNEAMIVAFGAMAGGNLKAVDRVVRIVSEMDRHHGFFPSRAPAPAERRQLAMRPEAPPALAPPGDPRSDGNGVANN